MQDERNASQIIRKDARNCFVESLSDAFANGRAHFAFATYDMNKPAGQRQTNNIHIYISVPELLELCRKLSCGELRYIMQQKKQTGDPKPIQEWLAVHLQRSFVSTVRQDLMVRVFPGYVSFLLARKRISSWSLTVDQVRRMPRV